MDFIVKISAFCIIEVKKYKGGRTVDELLQDMGEGLKRCGIRVCEDFCQPERHGKGTAESGAENSFSDGFVKELEGMGISREDLEGMRVRIGRSGNN